MSRDTTVKETCTITRTGDGPWEAAATTTGHVITQSTSVVQVVEIVRALGYTVVDADPEN